MSFRTRLFLAMLAAAVVPTGVLGLAVRREMGRRLTEEYEGRVDATAGAIQAQLAKAGNRIAARLGGVATSLADDNRFRLALRGDPGGRSYLIDRAGAAMRLAGLSMLEIQDDSGRILSSGHFRMEYDRLEPELPRAFQVVPGGTALFRARSPDGPFLALIRMDSLRLGARRLDLVGGVRVDRDLLGGRLPREGFEARLTYPGGELAAGAQLTSAATGGPSATFQVPFIELSGQGTGRVVPARLVISASLEPLDALRRRIDLWLLAILAGAAVAALAAAAWLSSRISRPLTALARRTRLLDLDGLNDVDAGTERADEIGVLSRALSDAGRRLRSSAARLREAERQATIGELARQVNHDIKNGLVPIRNALRHLAQVAGVAPTELAAAFRARQGSIESGVAYLETLASNYARLTPRMDRRPCNVNAVVGQVVAGVGSDWRVIVTELAEGLPPVDADPVALRRILENLISNGLDSLQAGSDTGPARVTVTTELEVRGQEGRGVRITVADGGRGMTPDEKVHAFEDFYTTKQSGTGLGLSVVRRLVRDLEGSVHLDSEPGVGTRVTVTLPASVGGTPGRKSVAGAER